jgi:hypothetical protein
MAEAFGDDQTLDLGPTAACEEVEEDLPGAAAALRQGDDLADRYPALARHLEECERCRAILAELVKEPEVVSEAEVQVEPSERYESYMTATLRDREPIVRARAAKWLGAADRLGPAALAELAEVAGEDDDEEVRETALEALDRLDEAVSLPRRLIEAWSAAPAEAAPFIAGALARLTSEGPPTNAGVVGLTGSTAPGGKELTLTGKEGISGLLREEQSELWLELNRLPSSFENAKAVVALPAALAAEGPAITWSGEQPGLVAVATPVVGGSLQVRLGEVVGQSGQGTLFQQVYVLNPEARRTRAS